MTWLALLLACGGGTSDGLDHLADKALIESIDLVRVKDFVDEIADDATGGRPPCSVGSTMAREMIEDRMMIMGLEPKGTDGFRFAYPGSGSDGFMLDAAGVPVPHVCNEHIALAGTIEGSDPLLKDEYVVLMAHYDHLGVKEEVAGSQDIFNGAFDDAAGVGVVLEVAELLLAHDGERPGRSILILITDGEEFGLTTPYAFLDNPLLPLDDIHFVISADPLGRAFLPDMGLQLMIGLERQPGLKARWKEAAPAFTKDYIAYFHRDVVPIFASDQDPFMQSGIPGVWYVNLGFSFYHLAADDPETIDYRVINKDVKYLLDVAYLVGDDPESYDFNPSPPIDIDAIVEARDFLLRVHESNVIEDWERELCTSYVAELNAAIDSGEGVDGLDNAEDFFLVVTAFLLGMTQSHPGQVPPPWPVQE